MRKLFILPTCPFCKKVMQFLDRHGIEMELADIQDPENLKELLEAGGKEQVPCLLEDGRAMYESDEIIAHLKEQTA